MRKVRELQTILLKEMSEDPKQYVPMLPREFSSLTYAIDMDKVPRLLAVKGFESGHNVWVRKWDAQDPPNAKSTVVYPLPYVETYRDGKPRVVGLKEADRFETLKEVFFPLCLAVVFFGPHHLRTIFPPTATSEFVYNAILEQYSGLLERPRERCKIAEEMLLQLKGPEPVEISISDYTTLSRVIVSDPYYMLQLETKRTGPLRTLRRKLWMNSGNVAEKGLTSEALSTREKSPIASEVNESEESED